ncbi:MAG: hypothetical protein BMS9Abin11_1785 [Gammaproteobacteria bacterium]|nr:MAG: hypothetical protein BMS9Abin11_1785 [Gammaproteobacteria bacterium]
MDCTILDERIRILENYLNVVFIIPTGVGCKIGGHAGDATPAAKLIAQTCNKIILHPNVVNASDINEMPFNSLYVEGSILDRFLLGEIELQEVVNNKVLVAISPPIKPETINAINAARVTLGMSIEIVELDTPLEMDAWVSNGVAGGKARGVFALIDQVQNLTFDALAIASHIHTDDGVALDYFINGGGVNPWGWIEARVSRQIASSLNKPVAHAPIESGATRKDIQLFHLLYEKVVDKRKAAEVCSNCYIHCILKGLHKAPRIGTGINRSSIACLVSPAGVVGTPHKACFDAGIPVIAIEENTTAFNHRDDRIIYTINYLEASGIVNCIMSGIQIDSVLADG